MINLWTEDNVQKASDLEARTVEEAMGLGAVIVPNTWMQTVVWKQVRFPRSKKGRIRRKWQNNRANWATVVEPWKVAYKIGGVWTMHEKMFERLKEQLSKVEPRLAVRKFEPINNGMVIDEVIFPSLLKLQPTFCKDKAWYI